MPVDEPSSGVVVRLATAGEHDAVDELTVAIYVAGDYASPNFLDHLRDAAGRAATADVLVAVDRDAGHLLGAVTVAANGGPHAQIAGAEEAEVRMLVAAPTARGRGVGEALVRACIERARAAGRSRIVLSTQPSMTDAHRLYERLGFIRAPERDWLLPHGVPMLVYTLDL